ncbi:MAG: hypothetical protein HQ481_14390 [Alphaproteobacteria bacterium]|nr:hypothetical protein [Alphaproteobacteria bacterium]
MTSASTIAECIDAAAREIDRLRRAAHDERLDRALEALLTPPPRGSAAHASALRDRPRLLAIIAEQYAHRCTSLRALADIVSTVGQRYEAERWPRDRLQPTAPDSLTIAEAACWRILRSTGSFVASSIVRAELSCWFNSEKMASGFLHRRR